MVQNLLRNSEVFMELHTKEYIITNLKSKQEIYELALEQHKWEVERNQESIKTLESKLDRITNQLNSLNQEDLLSIKLSDYFTEEELKDYNPNYEMLFEPDLPFRDWLDWFYEELPFLDNKHLKVIDLINHKEVNIFDVHGSTVVKVDHLNQRILVDNYQIVLPSINIYKLLSVNTNGKEYQTQKEEFE